jgi:nicotinamidase-related amidase
VPAIATLIVDMLNPYDHEDGDALAEQVRSRIEPIQAQIAATPDAGAELIYANDNYDDFTATSDDLARAALEGRHPDLVEPILPPDGSLFVEKVRHSAFYESSLNHLLRIKEIDTLVIAGQTTEQCILYTALDAYIRGFQLRVVRDAVAPLDDDLGHAALVMMERNMKAELVDAADAFG